MGWHLDGKVTAVVGTHTHVQTADERILPKGTAYLTDVGMTGPHDSIIGVEIEAGARPVPQRRCRRASSTATGNPRLNAVIVDADEQTGRATDIERLSYGLDELERPRRGVCQSAIFDLKICNPKSAMSDLFDLPFEDGAERPTPLPTPVAARRVLTRHRADRPRPRSARGASSSRSGSRASSRTAASGTPAICTSR